MRTARTALLFVLAGLAGSALISVTATPPAQAQDQDQDRAQREAEAGVKYRKRLLESMGTDQKTRLRAALEQFKNLSESKRAELRRRAKAVGSERLRELARYDGEHLRRLKRKHDAFRRQREEVLGALGGIERFNALPEGERGYIASRASRRFNEFVMRKLLDIRGNWDLKEWRELTAEERREKSREVRKRFETALLAELPPAERSAYQSLSKEQRKEKRSLLFADYRLRHLGDFATMFEHQFLMPFLSKPAEERAAAAEKWAARKRWFEMRHKLADELGLSREIRRLLYDLGPDDLSRLRDLYVDTQGLSADERRLRLHERIKELHGKAALDPDRKKWRRHERSYDGHGRKSGRGKHPEKETPREE